MDSISKENMSPVRSAKVSKRRPTDSPMSSVTPSRRRPFKQSKQHLADSNLEATMNESTFDVSCFNTANSEADRIIDENVESSESSHLLRNTEMEEKPCENEESVKNSVKASSTVDTSVNLTLGIFKEDEADLNDSSVDSNEAAQQKIVENIEPDECLDLLNKTGTEENNPEEATEEIRMVKEASNDTSVNLTLGIFKEDEADLNDSSVDSNEAAQQKIVENIEPDECLDLLNKTGTEENNPEEATEEIRMVKEASNDTSVNLTHGLFKEDEADLNDSSIDSIEAAQQKIAENIEPDERWDLLNKTGTEENNTGESMEAISTVNEANSDITLNMTLGIFKEDGGAGNDSFFDSHESACQIIAAANKSDDSLGLHNQTGTEKGHLVKNLEDSVEASNAAIDVIKDTSFNLTLGIFNEEVAYKKEDFADSNDAVDQNQEPNKSLLTTPANESKPDEDLNLTAGIFDEEVYSESGKSFIDAKEEEKQEEQHPDRRDHTDVGCDETLSIFEGRDHIGVKVACETVSESMEQVEAMPVDSINLTIGMFKEEENISVSASVSNAETIEEKSEDPTEITFTDDVPQCPVTGQLLTESLLEFEQIEKECLADATFRTIVEEDEPDSGEEQDRTMETNEGNTEKPMAEDSQQETALNRDAIETEVIISLLSIAEKVETLTMSIEGTSVSLEDELNAMNQAPPSLFSLADELNDLNKTAVTECDTLSFPGDEIFHNSAIGEKLIEAEKKAVEESVKLDELSGKIALVEIQYAEAVEKAAVVTSLEDSLRKVNEALEKKTAKLTETRGLLSEAEFKASMSSQLDVELRDCKALLASKDCELGEVSSQLAVVQNELAESKMKISDTDVLEGELCAAKNLLEKRSLQLEEMLAENNSIKAELFAMEANVAAKLRDAQLEIQEKEGRNGKISLELSCLGEELAAIVKQKTSLASQLEVMNNDLLERETRLEEFSAQSISLHSELNEARELIAHFECAKSELTEAKDGLRTKSQQVEDLTTEIEQLKTEVAAKAVVVTSLEDSLRKANEALEKKTAELTETRGLLSDAEFKASMSSQLDVELRDCKALLATKDCELGEVSSQLAVVQNELAESKMKAEVFTSLEDSLSKANEALETKTAELTETRGLLSDAEFKASMSSQLDVELRDCKALLASKDCELGEVSSQLAVVQHELAESKMKAEVFTSFEDSLRKVNEALEKKTAKLTETRGLLSEAEFKASMSSQLDVELRDCKALLASKDCELGEVSSQLAVVQNELAESKMKISDTDVLEGELCAATNLLEKRSLQLEEMSAENNSIKAERIAMEENVAAKLREAQLEIQEKEERNGKISVELSCLGEELAAIVKQKTSLASQLEVMNNDLLEREARLEEFSAQSISLHSELNEARELIAQFECAKSELTEAKDGLKTKSQQVEELTTEIEQLKTEVAAKAVLCSSLEDSVNTMKIQIDELIRMGTEVNAKVEPLLETERQLKNVQENMDILCIQLAETTTKFNEAKEHLSKAQEKASSVELLELQNMQLLEEKEKLNAEVEKLGKFLDDSEENEQVLTARINEYELKLRDREYGSTPGLLDALREGGHEVSRDTSKADDADSDNEAKFQSASSSPSKENKISEDSTDESPLRANSTLGPSFYRRIHEAPKTPGSPNKKANDSVCKQQ